jgi:hypothetical protein
VTDRPQRGVSSHSWGRNLLTANVSFVLLSAVWAMIRGEAIDNLMLEIKRGNELDESRRNK